MQPKGCQPPCSSMNLPQLCIPGSAMARAPQSWVGDSCQTAISGQTQLGCKEKSAKTCYSHLQDRDGPGDLALENRQHHFLRSLMKASAQDNGDT